MEVRIFRMVKFLKVGIKLNVKYHGYLLDLQLKVEDIQLIWVKDHLNLLLLQHLINLFTKPIPDYLNDFIIYKNNIFK